MCEVELDDLAAEGPKPVSGHYDSGSTSHVRQ
jgi:hypothetical protein